VQLSTLNLPEPRLPCLDLLYLSDRLVVAAGFDAVPLLLSRRTEGWALVGELQAQARAMDKKSAFSERLSAFKSQVDGRDAPAGADEPPGVHQNTITAVRRMPGRESVSTCGLDGRIAVWKTLAGDLSALSLQ
jgi:hypothetical protein